jgi:hypothetical protein
MIVLSCSVNIELPAGFPHQRTSSETPLALNHSFSKPCPLFSKRDINAALKRLIPNDFPTLAKNTGGVPQLFPKGTELFPFFFVFHMDIPKEHRYLPLLCPKESL